MGKLNNLACLTQLGTRGGYIHEILAPTFVMKHTAGVEDWNEGRGEGGEERKRPFPFPTTITYCPALAESNFLDSSWIFHLAYLDTDLQPIILRPVLTSHFTCAESNANEINRFRKCEMRRLKRALPKKIRPLCRLNYVAANLTKCIALWDGEYPGTECVHIHDVPTDWTLFRVLDTLYIVIHDVPSLGVRVNRTLTFLSS